MPVPVLKLKVALGKRSLNEDTDFGHEKGLGLHLIPQKLGHSMSELGE